MDEETIQLTDLIPIEKLMTLQEAFSRMTGIAAGISDAEGVPITEPSNSCDFCARLTKGTKLGEERCNKCDQEGGHLALQAGKAVVYVCHAGLVDCAAPITADGKLIGIFHSGQVRVGAMDVEKIVQTAKEIGVDPQEYLAAAEQTGEIDAGKLRDTMDFIYVVTNSLSDMAYKQLQLQKANVVVEQVARMKADFLANMSHEIRTPMNGVIGMAELALREELPPAARDYINQIKASGKTLLAIINDILDFSKIESGKLDIHEEEYEPLSVIGDIANVIMTRIGDKQVELNFDVPPDMPAKLYGDSIRIKQALINLANNAVKFTDKGQVVVRMWQEEAAEGACILHFAVEDTGIGIKKEEIGRIFQSFQQVDSKRNRQIEGTGLGLAISRRLIELMQGKLEVESEYGKGSTFSFWLPQKIVDAAPSISMENIEPKKALFFVNNPYTAQQLARDMERLGIDFGRIGSLSEIAAEQQVALEYLFVDWELFDTKAQEFAKANPQIEIVVMLDFRKKAEYSSKNVKIMKKPFYVLNLANLFLHHGEENEFQMDEDFQFIAPDAHILVVDDNAINLTVTEGLLEPLKMKIDTASSGQEAIDKISVFKYDVVFMDHMMPEIDGVETTHIIRRFHPEYNDVPIIALTANVIEGTKEMFIAEGMNDFVPKPIEIRAIVAKLHNWLPQEKQIRATNIHTEEKAAPQMQEIEGLDTRYALHILGSEKLYRTVLKDYYRVIDKKIALIRDTYTSQDWGRYTVEVHALKSSSKQIGAMELSEIAAEMEKAGNARDIQAIRENTDRMLELYESYKTILAPYVEEAEPEQKKKGQIEPQALLAYFEKLAEALENLDMDTVEDIAEEMRQFSYEGEQGKIFEGLLAAVEGFDTDACAECLQKWREVL